MLSLHMIPTNGDATLLRFADGHKCVSILIDGGNRKADCFSYLKSQGVTKIDLMIASHLDEDHIRGLRKVADNISVDELWITDVSAFVRPAAESMYAMKCFFASRMVVDGRRVKAGNKFAVYDGHKKQLGPFFLEVLSPPKSLHDYLRRPSVMQDILQSPKGRSIRQYIRDEIEKRLQEEGEDENRERREKVVSEVVRRFDVDVPQKEELEGLLEKDDEYWLENDSFYESARSLFNDISIVVKITFDHFGVRETFLFPGDLTNWSLVMASHPRRICGCVTKIPHHGSNIYVNMDEYSKCVASGVLHAGSWKTLPRHFYHILEEWRYFLGHSDIPPFWPGAFLGIDPTMWRNMDSADLYEYLSPKHSLIYPYKSSFSLPRLAIRNAIKTNSARTSCNFEEQDVSASPMSGEDPCMDCYGCIARTPPRAMVLNWP